MISIGLGLISVALVARYLGPQDLGSIAYVLSLISIASTAGSLGLTGLVVRDIVKSKDEHSTILGTVAFLKIASMSFGYIILILMIGVLEGFQSIEFYLTSIAGISLLFQPIEVIKFWFQAFVKSRYISFAEISSQAIATAFKIFLIIGSYNLIYFAAAPVLQGIVTVILLLIFLNLNSKIKILQWRISLNKIKELLSQSWIIYLASFLAIIYLKVDQVMLRWLSNVNEVGQYAIASQISEALYFIPTAIVVSFFPRLITLRTDNAVQFMRRLQQLFDILVVLSILAALFITFSASYFIPLIFGTAFEKSIPILLIHIWSGLFIFPRALFSKWILIENLLIFSLITQGLGAIANIGLNFLLIPKYGGVGAAYATLFSYATASFLSLLFYRKTRPIFWQMTLAFLSPIRYSYRVYGKLMGGH